MDIKQIENIELKYLTLNDYEELKSAMIVSYATMSGAYWKEEQIKALIDKFPDGQVVIKINGELAGVALSIVIDSDSFEDAHTYEEMMSVSSYPYGYRSTASLRISGVSFLKSTITRFMFCGSAMVIDLKGRQR